MPFTARSEAYISKLLSLLSTEKWKDGQINHLLLSHACGVVITESITLPLVHAHGIKREEHERNRPPMRIGPWCIPDSSLIDIAQPYKLTISDIKSKCRSP